MSSLLAAFAAGAGRSLDELPQRGVAHRLAGLWEAGRAAWPGVEVPAEDFARHLGRHLPRDAPPSDYLAAVQGDAMYLACGCALAVPEALGAFEHRYLGQVPALVAHIDPAPDFAVAVQELLRERLLRGHDRRLPRIAQYAGRGDFAGWVRAAALRVAAALRGRRRG